MSLMILIIRNRPRPEKNIEEDQLQILITDMQLNKLIIIQKVLHSNSYTMVSLQLSKKSLKNQTRLLMSELAMTKKTRKIMNLSHISALKQVREDLTIILTSGFTNNLLKL